VNPHDRALAIVYDAIDVVNRQLPAARRLRKAPETVIVGVGGTLDSLGLVNFVLALEDKVAATGTHVALLNDDMLIEDSPLRTVQTVSRYIAERLA
jgi:acyl carrier protein